MINLKNKKSQMKINEMLIMILALVIFFAIILMFFLSISLSGLNKSVKESTREGNILLVAKLADSPEFTCGEINCVDTDKLIALMNHINYRNYWYVDGLVVEKIEQNKTAKIVKCNFANYPNCNYFVIKEPANNTIQDYSIVSLCRKEKLSDYSYDKCELGKIVVMTKK